MHLRWVVRPQSPLHLPLSVFAAPMHSCLHLTGMTPDVGGVSMSDPWLSGVSYFCITLMVSIHHAANLITLTNWLTELGIIQRHPARPVLFTLTQLAYSRHNAQVSEAWFNYSASLDRSLRCDLLRYSFRPPSIRRGAWLPWLGFLVPLPAGVEPTHAPLLMALRRGPPTNYFFNTGIGNGTA